MAVMMVKMMMHQEDDDEDADDDDDVPWVKHTPLSPSTSLDNSQRSAVWKYQFNENNENGENDTLH